MALKILSKNDITCYNHDDGLYFFGERGFTPEGELFCSVKIGVASDLSKRIAQYKTHSCQLFHKENHILTKKPSFCKHWGEAEEFAHDMINLIALGKPPYGWEWYYVSEPVYFELCKDPWQIFNQDKIEELKKLAKETKNNNRFYIEKTKYDILHQEYDKIIRQISSYATLARQQTENIDNLNKNIAAYKKLVKAYEDEKQSVSQHYLYSIKFNSAPWWKRILMAMRII